MYVAGGNGNNIRKLSYNGTAWDVTTIAGASATGTADGIGTAARFNQPYDITIDAAGNLYVADCVNNLIRKLSYNGTAWDVTTIAGGTAGFADGAGTAAQFIQPMGIAMDAAGNLYVGDDGNHRIRKLRYNGTDWDVTTVAGDGSTASLDGPGLTAQIFGPRGIKVDAVGNIYIAENGNHRIRKITFE
jgi:secreted PhoX family phosphatase